MTESQPHSVEVTALSVASYLQHLDPGKLAELRRLGSSTVGSPAYWRLAARHPDTVGNNHNVWQSILRCLAILTPRGDPEKRQPLHNPKGGWDKCFAMEAILNGRIQEKAFDRWSASAGLHNLYRPAGNNANCFWNVPFEQYPASGGLNPASMW